VFFRKLSLGEFLARNNIRAKVANLGDRIMVVFFDIPKEEDIRKIERFLRQERWVFVSPKDSRVKWRKTLDEYK